MPLTDKTGAPVTVEKKTDEFTISVEGNSVGLEAFAERDWAAGSIRRKSTKRTADAGWEPC